MRKMIISLIGIIVVIMIMVLVYFGLVMPKPLSEQVAFEEKVYGLSIEPYYDETDDIYYLFLPSYVSPSDITVDHANSLSIDFKSDTTDYEDSIKDLPLSENITLTIKHFVRKNTYTFCLRQCENLPTIYVETAQGGMDSVNADKDYEEDMSVVVLNDDSSLEYSGSGKISGRGNGSWNKEKKPYNLEFSSDISIGTFERVSTLCLLAEYSDESKLRNGIAYYAGEQLGISYASPYVYTDLYVNGEYYGVYGVVTKQEYKKYIDQDDIVAVFESGSRQFSATGKDEFDSLLGRRITVMYGDVDKVESQVEKLETALKQHDFETCESMIDIVSWARSYTFEEFVANWDLLCASKYYYMDSSGIIHAMLPWDYDLSLGSQLQFFNDMQEYEILAYRKYNDNTSWYTLLLEDEEFVLEILKGLEAQYTSEFIDDLKTRLAAWADTIESSRENDRILYRYSTPYSGEYDAASGMENLNDFVSYFSSYFTKRVNFLKDYFANMHEYCCVEWIADDEYYYCNICIPCGEKLSDYTRNKEAIKINRNDDAKFLGWHTTDGLRMDDIDEVTEDITFTGEFEGGYTSESSLKTLADKIYNNFARTTFGEGSFAYYGTFVVFVIFGIGLVVLCCVEVARHRGGRKNKNE